MLRLPATCLRAVTGALLCAAFLGPLGCGEDEPLGTPPTSAKQDGTTRVDSELLAYTSSALRRQQSAPTRLSSGHDFAYSPELAYADLDGARRQLALPGDAPLDADSQRLLFTIAARPLFLFSTTFRPRPQPGAIGRILDTGEISAAAGTNLGLAGPSSDQVGPEDLLAVRTRQPFDEIAVELEAAGYTESEPGLFLSPSPLDLEWLRFASDYKGLAFPAVRDAGGGIVLFGGSGDIAAVEPDPNLSALASFVADLPGVSRAAMGLGNRGCARAVGLGEAAQPRRGQLVVVVDGRPIPARHAFAGQVRPTTFFSNTGGPEASEGEVQFSRASAEGDRVSAAFVSTDSSNVTRLAIEEINRPYSCPKPRAGRELE